MTKEMTKGSPMKLIVGFSFPLLLGFLFQQFYNLVDTVIVGRFLGVNDLAAVGATGSINFLIIGFCMGVCNGFSIPISQKFGARDYESMRKYVANCLWLGILFSVVMTAVTLWFCKDILILMKTPGNIIEGAYTYIWIIFLGIPTVYLYNIVAGIIRALGDSKTPVVFLVLSSVINIVLDLFFIINLKMGISGAAWATVISQGISGIGCLAYMIRKFELLHVQKGEWAPNFPMIGTLCGMGVPMGLQYSITAIGSVVLQSATNALGSSAVAAVTAGSKLANFFSCPYEALGSTMATYGGQNIGAGRLDRIGKGLKSCVILGTVYFAAAFIISVLFGDSLALLFVESSETEIITNAKMFLVFNTAFYFLLCLVNGIRFLIQGMGFPFFAILAGIFEMIARTVTGFVLVPMLGFTGVCLGSPIAWLLADLFLVPAYFHVSRVLKKRTFIS